MSNNAKVVLITSAGWFLVMIVGALLTGIGQSSLETPLVIDKAKMDSLDHKAAIDSLSHVAIRDGTIVKSQNIESMIRDNVLSGSEVDSIINLFR